MIAGATNTEGGRHREGADSVRQLWCNIHDWVRQRVYIQPVDKIITFENLPGTDNRCVITI